MFRYTTAFALLPILLLAGCPYSAGYDDDDAAYSESDDDDGAGTWGDDDDATGDDDDSQVSEPTPPEDVEDALCEDAPTEPVTFYVSADDSNSQAQPAWIRSAIDNGRSWWGSIRPYEFLNYYDFDFGPQNAVTLVPQLRETADGLSLLVAVVAPDKEPGARRPLNLTLSLDLSGSMAGPGINGMKAALRAISAELIPGDRVSAVQWSVSQAVLLDNHSVVGANDPTLASLIDNLSANGGTDLNGGLTAAYAIATANASAATLDRVVLISDGYANVGVTAADLIAESAEDGDSDGIYLAAIGVGDLSEQLMDTITDLGRGSYLFVDTQEEANRKLRGPAFLASMDLAAREVRLDVTLPEGIVIDVFSGEEISENPEDVRPQHLAPNDAMLYHFQLVDCLQGQDWAAREIGLHVEWLEPFLGTPQSADLTVSLQDLLLGTSEHVLKADAIVRYAALLGGQDLDTDVITEARLQLPSDVDLQEIERILGLVGML